nr:MAG TPA: Primosomal replication protein N'', Replication restart, PriC, DNA [Bacteriophage sp.]
MRFAEIFKTELFSKHGQKAGCYINEIYDIINCSTFSADILE